MPSLNNSIVLNEFDEPGNFLTAYHPTTGAVLAKVPVTDPLAGDLGLVQDPSTLMVVKNSLQFGQYLPTTLALFRKLFTLTTLQIDGFPPSTAVWNTATAVQGPDVNPTSGLYYQLWQGVLADRTTQGSALQQINIGTQTLVQMWEQWSPAALGANRNVCPGCSAVDDSAYFYTILNGRTIYKHTFGTATESTVAVYGTTDYRVFNGASLKRSATAQMGTCFGHWTGSAFDAVHFVLFNTNGSIAIDIPLAANVADVQAFAFDRTGATVWIIGFAIDTDNAFSLSQYDLTSGLRLHDFTIPQIGQFYTDMIVMGVPPSPPPTTALPSPFSTAAGGQVDTGALLTGSHTLVLDLKGKRWMADAYPSPVTVRVEEPGAGVHDQILGHVDGTVDVFSGQRDQNHEIAYAYQTGDFDNTDPRRNKTFGDLFLSADPKGGNGFTATPLYDNGQSSLSSSQIGVGVVGRSPFVVDVLGGSGLITINMGLLVSGADGDVAPVFDLIEWAFVPKVERTFLRATDWTDGGAPGSKLMQGVIIQADLGGQSRQLKVEYDNGQFSEVFTLSDSIENQIPYSFLSTFVAHMVRIVPVDAGSWLFYGAEWRFQPVPELVSTWSTPGTTKDFRGYSQDERALISHQSIYDFNFVVTADGVSDTYTVPNSSGQFVKTEILLRSRKGLVWQYQIQTINQLPGVRVYQQDLEIWSRSWGSTEPYQSLRPFGDASRGDSAARI